MTYGPFSFCLPKKKMGEKKKGTEIEPPVESRRPYKPTISTHRESVESESECGWVEIETHGFSRPSHTAIDFRGSGPLSGNSRNGFIHHTLYAHSTELPKSSEGALGGLTCGFNFRACEMISMVYSFSRTEIMASALEELRRAL
ncbi:MAG: hypothetical protein Q8P51_06030 [Ignavibacteria bacterium]|nr:hypothetical protein [Ignavibacteria bacterium]